MPISEPSTLPTELLGQIIDEALDAQSFTDLRYERGIISPQTFSSGLARVSHVFRQRVNAHRFSTVSFYTRKSSLADIHAFLDLLRSDVWAAPSVGVAPHIRKLELVLSDTDEGGVLIEHPATHDGSFTTIMNTVFRGIEGCTIPRDDYTLALYGHAKSRSFGWKEMNSAFISNLEFLLDSYISTFELTWFHLVPPKLVKRQRVKHLKIWFTTFSGKPQCISDFIALGPWNHITSLDIRASTLFTHTSSMTMSNTPRLKALTIFVADSSIASSISRHWQYWNLLEDLTLNLNNATTPNVKVDFRRLSNLKNLTINLRLSEYYGTDASDIKLKTDRILNIVGSTMHLLSYLEIFVDADFRFMLRFQDTGFAHDITFHLDCTAIDSVLAGYPTSAISTIVVRFGIKFSRRFGDDLDLEKLRKDGLDGLRQAFPRLNAGPRKRAYDSVVSKKWKDRVRRDSLLHNGMFFVVYTPAPEKVIR